MRAAALKPLRPAVSSGIRVCTPRANQFKHVCSASILEALPANYGFVLASVATTAIMVQYKAVKVALARRQCGVEYPKMYADGNDKNAMIFNCTQRAHQNTLETVPMVLAMECLLGLQFPIYAATLGMVWNVGRVIYGEGYSKGDPNARIPGVAIAGLTYVVLILSTLVTGLVAVAPPGVSASLPGFS